MGGPDEEAPSEGGGWLPSLPSFLQGPRLQVANLVTFLVVVYATVDFPNPPEQVLACVVVAAALDAGVSRWRYGGWRVPWSSIIGAMGAWLVLDGHGWTAYILVGVLMVAVKHAIRWRGEHLFNPNNAAMVVLILLGMARVGVNDWGSAPQTVALMVLFGTISTTRVDRFDLAVMYLALSFLVYLVIAQINGWGLATVWMWALSPVQVMIGFFAITDPATSPGDSRLVKAAWALLLVLVGVPATLAGRVEAPIFALFIAGPQRHLVRRLVEDGLGGLRARLGGPTASPTPGGEAP